MVSLRQLAILDLVAQSFGAAQCSVRQLLDPGSLGYGLQEHIRGAKPGEGMPRDKVNQAGSTGFVLLELVPGTLREAFERILALVDPLARALMTMFVVREVHPFIDGNGRTARLAMNSVLSAAGLSRIIVPTVYCENYLLPLMALSNNADAKPFVAAMTRNQSWSARFDYVCPVIRFAPD